MVYGSINLKICMRPCIDILKLYEYVEEATGLVFDKKEVFDESKNMEREGKKGVKK